MVEKNSEENPQTRFEVKPFKYLFRFGRGLSITKNDLIEEGFPVVNYGEIHSKCKITTNANKFKLPFVSLDYLEKSPNCLCNDGTVIFADTSEDVEGAGNFTQISGDAKVFAGYHCVTAVPTHDLFSKYVPFALDSLYFRNQIRKNVRGVKVYSVTRKILGEALLPIPSYSEQRQIAAYLNRETAKIDNLISKQKKLIALLKEKRQAVISQAVTKGLDPNVEMKEVSDVWLNKVPSHWDFKKLSFVLKFENKNRRPISADERGSFQGEFPYYGASGIIDYVADFIFDGDRILVGEDGANLVNRSSPLAFVASGKYWVNNHAHILSPPDELSSFWADLLESRDYSLEVTGSAQPKLTMEALASIRIPVPPYSERLSISEYLRDEKALIDKLIDKCKKAISLMQERRQALITAAVTGKIDVRDLVTDEEVAALDAEVEQDEFDSDVELEDLDEPELASEEE